MIPSPRGQSLDEIAEEALHQRSRAMWHPVAFADDFDDQPMAVRLLDEAIAIARIDGDVVAFKDLCIHRGTALSRTVVDGGLQCAYHGWTFDPTGACVDSFATGGVSREKPGCGRTRSGVHWVGLGARSFRSRAMAVG